MSSENVEGKEKKKEKTRIKPRLDKETIKSLKLRSILSAKRPRFIRMNSWIIKRLDDSWRSPRRSLDNKIRLQRKGFPPLVKIGYRGPFSVRNLHPSGFKEVIVHNPQELEGIDPSTQAVRIASTVGRRKRIEIIKKAEEKGIRILNAGGVE
ncbi:MAG: 50S ribosomal protein L32e [Infirmifilum sp.]|jgi:large subunit ribosomal protein L32e|uniref:50S ribosomal protein L32e n=1 Tax=Infirmifilum TaxID=2856573 RepID=UPI003C77E73D